MTDSERTSLSKRPGDTLNPANPPKKPRLNQTAPFVSSFPAPASKLPRRDPATSSNAHKLTAAPKFAFPSSTPKKNHVELRAAPTPVKFAIPLPAAAKPKPPAKRLAPPKDPFPDVPTTPVKPRRVAKPPMLAFTHVPDAPTTPAKPVREVKPPVLAAKTPKPTPAPMRTLKPPGLPAPRAAHSPEPTKRPLRVPLLQPPPSANPDSSSSSSTFMPLSSTRFAFASSEVGAQITQSLLANTTENPENRALVRGMGMSPEKPNRNRRYYAKGALADMAKQVIDRESVAHHLWQQETRAVQNVRRLGPTLTVSVRKVLNRSEHSGTPSAPRGVLALCVLPDGVERRFYFSASGEPIRGMNPVDVQEGARVMIWSPWIELNQPAKEPAINAGDDVFQASDAGAAASPTLLCSRFVVAR